VSSPTHPRARGAPLDAHDRLCDPDRAGTLGSVFRTSRRRCWASSGEEEKTHHDGGHSSESWPEAYGITALGPQGQENSKTESGGVPAPDSGCTSRGQLAPSLAVRGGRASGARGSTRGDGGCTAVDRSRSCLRKGTKGSARS